MGKRACCQEIRSKLKIVLDVDSLMQFDSFSDFLTMGGHGVYVWTVYGVALLVLLVLIITPLRRDRRFFLEQSMLLRRDQAADRNMTNPDSK